jgi:sec-independent protein translocase protein TatB
MFNIGWQEILIISVVVILILGPKELPAALKTFLGVTRKIRHLSSEFLNEAENFISKEDLDKVKESMENIQYEENLSSEVNEFISKEDKK